MKGIDGRVYSPFRVRLLLGKRAAEHGWEKGAITMIERDPTPEGPSIFYIDSETARMVASQLTDAAHRLDKTQNPTSSDLVRRLQGEADRQAQVRLRPSGNAEFVMSAMTGLLREAADEIERLTVALDDTRRYHAARRCESCAAGMAKTADLNSAKEGE